jgi:hypothetical protein
MRAIEFFCIVGALISVSLLTPFFLRGACPFSLIRRWLPALPMNAGATFDPELNHSSTRT